MTSNSQFDPKRNSFPSFSQNWNKFFVFCFFENYNWLPIPKKFPILETKMVIKWALNYKRERGFLHTTKVLHEFELDIIGMVCKSISFYTKLYSLAPSHHLNTTWTVCIFAWKIELNYEKLKTQSITQNIVI